MMPSPGRTRASRPPARSPVSRRSPLTVAGNGRREAAFGAYQRLRELIVAGRLAPGAPLIETELSARLGVSRTPVRAALQRLHQEGFVGASPAGQMLRAFVSPLTADDLREVFLMVGCLEAVAARLAASLGAAERGTLCEGLAGLDEGLRAAAAARPPDLVSALDLHGRFRRAMAHAAAGPRLRAELDVLEAQAERYERVYTGTILLAFEEGAAERAAIIAAIRGGDAAAAEAAVAASWRGAAERYRQVVSILGERGNW